MATWVRTNTGTLPSATDADLTGSVALGNQFPPADFNPDSVNSVRIEATVAVTSGTFQAGGAEKHDVHHALEFGVPIFLLASVDGADGILDDGTNGGSSSSVDQTDSTIPGGATELQWRISEVEPQDVGGVRRWTTFTQSKGADGVTVAVTSVTVTIDYSPAGPTHTTDMQLSLQGVAAGHYIPNGVVAIQPMLQGLSAFTTVAIDETDTSNLISRAWQSFAPEKTDYGYYTSSASTPSTNFASAIKAYDVDPNTGAMAVQLSDGSVHLGRWYWGRSQFTYSSTYYFSDWARGQAQFTNGPQYRFYEIVSAPTTAPGHFAVSVSHHSYYLPDPDDYAEWGWVAYQGEPESGQEKVYCARFVVSSDINQWGRAGVTTNVGTIDGIYAQSFKVDADNSTDDEKLVGIAWSSPARMAPSTVDQWRINAGCRVWYTHEGASSTHLYNAWLKPFGVQEVWTDATSGSFTLKYPHSSYATESNSISYNDNASSVQTALNAMSELSNAAVTGSGTQSDPWLIDAQVWDPSSTAYITKGLSNYLTEGGTNTLNGNLWTVTPSSVQEVTEISHQSIPKIQHAGLSGTRGYPASWAFYEQSTLNSFHTVSILVKQTNGKLGILMPTPSWYGADSEGALRRDVMHWYASDVSSGNVYVDANGYVAAAWYPFARQQQDANTSTDYPFMQYDFVVYVDATSQDLKRVTRARYGKEND